MDAVQALQVVATLLALRVVMEVGREVYLARHPIAVPSRSPHSYASAREAWDGWVKVDEDERVEVYEKGGVRRFKAKAPTRSS